MNTVCKAITATLAALGCFLARVQPCSASEPIDNTPPWTAPYGLFSGNASLFISTGGGGGTSSGSIETSTDVDYFIMSCTGSSPRIVQSVGINLTHSSGDLDIEAYTLAGEYIGLSNGVGDNEYVYTSARRMQSIIIKVYGYRGAINNYSLFVTCTGT
jgi:hypothetical protein